MTWRHPVDKVHLGSTFGIIDQWHKAPGHRGTDYNGFAVGYPLKAVNDGKVVLNKWSDVLGNVVVLKVGSWYIGYCHMQKPSPIKVGKTVKSGDIIGAAGNTGSASAGVHLHATLSKDINGVFSGKVYDLYKYITKQIAAQKAAAKAPQVVPVVTPVAPVTPPVATAPASYVYPPAPEKLKNPGYTKELKKGSKGTAVAYLQQQLGIHVTRIFDDATVQAVKKLQKKKKLTVDGIVGPLTWKAIG